MSYVSPIDPSATCGQGLSIYDVLATQTERAPDAIAIAAPGRIPLTYGRLRIHIDYVMQTLNAMGLGRNDRVALVLPNGPEMAVAFLAIAAGATSAPLNPAYQANEFDFYLSDLHAKALLIQPGIDSPARAVAHKRGIALLECAPVFEAEAGIFTLRGEDRSRVAGENDGTLLPGFAQPDDVALVLHTSGTTARPKLVPLTHTNICTAAHNMQVALELTEQDRCLSMMPLFHIHGLIGATLAPLAAGASIACTPGFDVTTFFEWLEALHPTWYTAVPTMHQAIVTRAEGNRETIARCPLRFIRSSSAALPPQVMAELERVFQAPVIESYGMTEASLQITCNPLPPRERKAGSVGVAAGPEIAIMDDIGNMLPPRHEGEIVIRGANVTQGYENNPTANKSAFTHEWFRTGDQGFLDADGYLFITGRLKEIINRGGEKIAPREVDEVLLAHPSVAEAVTFAVPHLTLGEDVAAAVVLRQEASVKDGDIQRFAATRLAPFKVPRQLLIVPQIPKNATGKVQRVGLAEKLGLTGPAQGPRANPGGSGAPRTPLEKKLAKIWAQVIGLTTVGIFDNFFDLGGNSLLAAQIVAQIWDTCGKNFPVPALFRAATIEQLSQLLQQEEWPELWSSLVPIQPKGSKPPFFWVHGDASAAFLPRYLGPDQPLYELHHQSQDGKPARYTQVETIAAHYLEEIRTVQPQGAYFLGGFSFGGTIAFEMAQQLKRHGEAVAFLLLLDSYFPGDNVPGSAAGKTNTTSFRDELRRHFDNLALVGTKEKLTYLSDRIIVKLMNPVRRIKQSCKKIACKVCLGIGLRMPFSLRSIYIVGMYDEARRKYRPQRYPGRAIYVKSALRPQAHRVAWEKLMDGGLEVYEVPGDHLDVIKESYASCWAEKLKTWLDTAQEALRPPT